MDEMFDKFGQPIFEMSNLRPRETGLPMVIWVNPSTGKEKHGPRIKVQTFHGTKSDPDKLVAVGFTRDGKIENFGGLSNQDFKLVSNFIENNLNNLLRLWDDEISPVEFAQAIVK
jgi:hypothetical protein